MTDDALIGRDVGGFTVLARLGAGGMGVVYRARQRSIDREVALKIMDARLAGDATSAKRFLREAHVVSRLSHPHIVAVHDCGQSDDGLLFLAMELVPGETLAERLRVRGPFLPEALGRIAVQLCDALEAAHARGIVHRDLKPSNVMLVERADGRDFVKVLDFGVARLEGAELLTQSDAAVGTPRYMAPEAIAGQPADERVDLYALGVMLLELGAPPQSLLANIARKLTAREPEARYPSAALTRAALEAALTPSGGAPTPATRDGRGRAPAPIRLLIVDDQALFREGLRTVLSAVGDLDVVGEADNGEEALARVDELRPDVILMDLSMPVLDGVATLRRLRERPDPPPVIALTTFDDDESVFEALRAGAIGYLLKDTSSQQLAEAVRAAARGESFLQPRVAAKVVSAFAALATPAPLAQLERLGLSAREIEVLREVARGASNKEIAVALDIAEGTVKNHVTSILNKLGVTDRTQAALKARDLGLV